MNIDFTSFDQALDKAETNAPDMEKVWAEIRAFDIPSELETFLSKKVAGMDPFSQEYRDIMQEIHGKCLIT